MPIDSRELSIVFIYDGWGACDSSNFIRKDRGNEKTLTKWNLDYQD